MGKQDRFTDEFKRDAVAHVEDRGKQTRTYSDLTTAERCRAHTDRLAMVCLHRLREGQLQGSTAENATD